MASVISLVPSLHRGKQAYCSLPSDFLPGQSPSIGRFFGIGKSFIATVFLGFGIHPSLDMMNSVKRTLSPTLTILHTIVIICSRRLFSTIFRYSDSWSNLSASSKIPSTFFWHGSHSQAAYDLLSNSDPPIPAMFNLNIPSPQRKFSYVLLSSEEKIPHTGDTESLDRCGS